MSVSIITQPTLIGSAGLYSANNASIYTVASPLSGNTDYLYVGDVYINGNKAVTLKSFPDPLYGYGVFDLNSIANKYVSYDFAGSTSNEAGLGIHPAYNSSTLLQIKFREQYTSGSTYYAPSGTTDSTARNYSNASLSYADSILTPNLNAYFISSTHNGKFLTTLQPLGSAFVRDAPKTLRQWLYFFSYGSGSTYPYAHIATFSLDGGTIGHYRLTNPVSATTGGIQYISVGYPQLAALPTSGYTTISGPSTIMGATVASYQVQVTYNATSGFFPASDVVTFTIRDECTKFSDTYSLYWLNSLGGFDSFRFALKNQTTYSKNQSNYKKIQGTLNADGSYTKNTYDPANVNFFTEVTTEIQLNSDWLTDTQVSNLKHLFSSPAVFIEDSNGTVQACTINDKSYLLHKRVNGNKAYSLQMTVSLSSTSYRQLL